MIIRALSEIGVAAALSGDEPTSEADYIARVKPVSGQLPPWSELSAKMLALKKRVLKVAVDDDAERVRLRYITPGGGMAMTYAEKKDQAVAVLAMGEASANGLVAHGAAEFPTLSASVPIEAPSLYAAAQLVIAKYEAWAAISRGIELTRLTGKKAISDASDAAAAQAAYEAITWPSP